MTMTATPSLADSIDQILAGIDRLPKFEAQGREYSQFTFMPNDPNSKSLYVETRDLMAIMGNLAAGEAVGLMGESGVAKTTLARALLMRLKPDTMHMMEFGGVTDPSLLEGTTIVVNGDTMHRPTEHLIAVREASSGMRVAYIQDELNRASSLAINKLLRLYEDPYEYVSDEDGVLQVPRENLITIATLNIGFGFTGTYRVDTAIAQRYTGIVIEAPPREILGRILEERFEQLSHTSLNAIGQIYEASRASDEGYQLSVRDALRVARTHVKARLDLFDAIDVTMRAAARMENLPEEAVESIISTAKSVCA
jgi:energy-coupling factor transporter ATP-binding protein EcfA2